MRRNDKLIIIANVALKGSSCIWYDDGKSSIAESYNGKTAAFGVSVAMIGLLPTLAIYYKDEVKDDKRDKNSAYGRDILEVISKMFSLDKENTNTISEAKDLLNYAIESEESQLKVITEHVIDYSVALKQVIRTYKLVKKDDKEYK